MTEDANNDPIGKKLGLPSIPTNESKIKSILADAHNDSAIRDFEAARSNTIETIEKINEAIFELAQVSKQSQSARHYEVLGQMFKTALEASGQLLHHQTSIRKIEQADEIRNENANIDNHNTPSVFIGTTADLQNVLKQLNNRNEIDITPNKEED